MPPRDRLTGREVQVAQMVWEGLTNRDIGQRLGTTEQVVKNYLRSTFDKLGVWSRLELALYVAGHGGCAVGGLAGTGAPRNPGAGRHGSRRLTGPPIHLRRLGQMRSWVMLCKK
jgi:DNA-binding CsgD family transcriptional regulator